MATKEPSRERKQTNRGWPDKNLTVQRDGGGKNYQINCLINL